MIVGIQGVLEHKEPTFLHINVNGLIYEVFVSLNTSSQIESKDVKLFATQIIREDTNMLFGFFTKWKDRNFK